VKTFYLVKNKIMGINMKRLIVYSILVAVVVGLLLILQYDMKKNINRRGVIRDIGVCLVRQSYELSHLPNKDEYHVFLKNNLIDDNKYLGNKIFYKYSPMGFKAPNGQIYNILIWDDIKKVLYKVFIDTPKIMRLCKDPKIKIDFDEIMSYDVDTEPHFPEWSKSPAGITEQDSLTMKPFIKNLFDSNDNVVQGEVINFETVITADKYNSYRVSVIKVKQNFSYNNKSNDIYVSTSDYSRSTRVTSIARIALQEKTQYIFFLELNKDLSAATKKIVWNLYCVLPAYPDVIDALKNNISGKSLKYEIMAIHKVESGESLKRICANYYHDDRAETIDFISKYNLLKDDKIKANNFILIPFLPAKEEKQK